RQPVYCIGATLPARRLWAASAAQPLLSVALLRRRGTAPDCAHIRLMRRHLVLFVRAPALGIGKRRLARDIGDVAAVRFERLMIALLLRRLGRDRRWLLRIAITPDGERRHARHWCRGVQAFAQGSGGLGLRMRRA